MNGHELASYLSSRGFVVKSVSTVDALSNSWNKVPASPAHTGVGVSKPLIRAPFLKGITDASLPSCHTCNKFFATDTALANHNKVEHMGEMVAKAEPSNEVNENGKRAMETVTGTQYQVVDSSFIGSENSDDAISFVVIRTMPDYTFNNAARRARRIETKPRRAYEARLPKAEAGAPYTCVDCSKVFDNCCKYSYHHNKEHGKRKRLFSRCQICETKFESPVYFEDQLGEESSKAFECDICSKSFPQKSGLEHHMLTHGKLKPYPCGVCKKTFSQPANLAQHMKVHGTADSYACGLCNRVFKQASHLNFHMKAHSKYSAPKDDSADPNVLDIYITEEQLSKDVSIILKADEEQS